MFSQIVCWNNIASKLCNAQSSSSVWLICCFCLHATQRVQGEAPWWHCDMIMTFTTSTPERFNHVMLCPVHCNQNTFFQNKQGFSNAWSIPGTCCYQECLLKSCRVAWWAKLWTGKQVGCPQGWMRVILNRYLSSLVGTFFASDFQNCQTDRSKYQTCLGSGLFWLEGLR